MLPSRLLQRLDRAAAWAGIAPGRLDADGLMAAALRRAGRRRFSNSSFVEPLHRLLAAYDTEADLTLFGRFAARFDVARSLGNLLCFDAMEEAQPQIRQRRIVRPIFITGLPRSGTTFLHTLLAQDPVNAVPRSWQLIYPYPGRIGDVDHRRANVERQLRFFRHLSPGLDGMHPLSADAPQECTDITSQVFQSLRFDTTHHIPSYQAWIDDYGHHAAYRFHRRFLQHLDAQMPGKQWVFKCPDHVFALDALLAAYPDAKIVLLHRDPLDVLASVAKLTELVRKPFTRNLDRAQIGHQVSARWADGADRLVAAAGQRVGRQALHLHYREVVADPMTAIAALYRHCGIGLSDEARRRMALHLAHRPRGGYGVHHHSLEPYGLDATVLRKRFARYMDRFCVAPGSGEALKRTAERQSAA